MAAGSGRHRAFPTGPFSSSHCPQQQGIRLKASRNETQPTVIIIDDDRDIREALEGLLRSVGLRVELFASVQEFLDHGRPNGPGCLVLDVRLPGRSGLEFHDSLIEANVHVPVVFISGHADVPMSVRAMKAGAIEFLTKPVRDQELLDAIHLAITRDSDHRNNERAVAEIRANFDNLTQREREVLELVLAGRLNKQIAGDIGISLATVKAHRGHVMRKMKTQSLTELVRMVDRLRPAPPKN
jgi:FixJ family two-component response regulator